MQHHEEINIHDHFDGEGFMVEDPKILDSMSEYDKVEFKHGACIFDKV